MTLRPIYMTSGGVSVASVTEVLSATRSQDWLIDWAVKMARRGDDHEAVRDRAARVGTIAHELIAANLQGRAWDIDVDTDPREMKDAEKAYDRWLEFASNRKIEPLIVEEPFVSDEQEYGGTPDMLAIVDGVRTVIDFKTGRYPGGKGLLQLGAYARLLTENGYGPVERGMIACIGARDAGLYSFDQTTLETAGVTFLGLMACIDMWDMSDEVAEAARQPTNDWLD